MDPTTNISLNWVYHKNGMIQARASNFLMLTLKTRCLNLIRLKKVLNISGSIKLKRTRISSRLPEELT